MLVLRVNSNNLNLFFSFYHVFKIQIASSKSVRKKWSVLFKFMGTYRKLLKIFNFYFQMLGNEKKYSIGSNIFQQTLSCLRLTNFTEVASKVFLSTFEKCNSISLGFSDFMNGLRTVVFTTSSKCFHNYKKLNEYGAQYYTYFLEFVIQIKTTLPLPAMLV